MLEKRGVAKATPLLLFVLFVISCYGSDYMNESFIKKALLGFWEILKVAIVSLAIILPVRYFLVQPFFVIGASMEPNFSSGDYLIIDELSYRFDNPKRGQVVVFKYPLNPKEYYIKRVVGLPGETVIVKDGKVTIKNSEYSEGFVLDESMYFDRYTGKDTENSLKENEYFVLGDNRDVSSDSRTWGAVPKSLIVGRAWVRVFPFNEFQLFSK